MRSVCSECESVMIRDLDGGYLCPVCDHHNDCDDYPCAGWDGDVCALRRSPHRHLRAVRDNDSG